MFEIFIHLEAVVEVLQESEESVQVVWVLKFFIQNNIVIEYLC